MKEVEAGFKAKVALEAIKGEKAHVALSSLYGVHNIITRWKQEALEKLPGIFDKKAARREETETEEKAENLYKAVGELKMENDWLKEIGDSDLISSPPRRQPQSASQITSHHK